MSELDQKRVERITAAIFQVIKDNYPDGPHLARTRCFEALNALAVATAVIIQGADGPGGDAQRFFTQGLEKQLAEPI